MSSNAVLLVGNGFDKSLGLPTTYSDFIQSKEFEELITNKNVIALYTKEFSKGKSWAGIETDLIKIENYSVSSRNNPLITREEEFIHHIGLRNVLSQDLKKDYLSLIKNLKKYLIRISNEVSLNFDSPAFQMFEYFLSNFNFNVYSFNYTDTIENCLIEFEKNGKIPGNWAKGRMKKVHGSLVNDDIVFGVNDGTIKSSNNLYLLKSIAKSHGQSGLKNHLKEMQIIFVFGFSFGETDYDYFKELFVPTINKKKFYIYYYDEASYDSFSKMLYKKTGESLSIYKNNNEFIFIKSSSIQDSEKNYYTRNPSY